MDRIGSHCPRTEVFVRSVYFLTSTRVHLLLLSGDGLRKCKFDVFLRKGPLVSRARRTNTGDEDSQCSCPASSAFVTPLIQASCHSSLLRKKSQGSTGALDSSRLVLGNKSPDTSQGRSFPVGNSKYNQPIIRRGGTRGGLRTREFDRRRLLAQLTLFT